MIVLFDKGGKAVWVKKAGSFEFPKDNFAWLCDSEGNQLLWDGKSGELSAFACDGETIGCVIRCGETESIKSFFHDEEGNLLYGLTDMEGGTKLFRYDFTKKNGELLMESKDILCRFFGMKEGKLLYVTGNHLLWGAPGDNTAVQLLAASSADIRFHATSILPGIPISL